MPRLFSIVFLIIFTALPAYAATIFLRDGQVISDVRDLREFESVFIYQDGTRSVTLSKDRVFRVEGDNGEIIYELRVLTMEKMDGTTTPVQFQFFMNGQPIAQGEWYDEGKFRVTSGSLPDGEYNEYFPSGRIEKIYRVENGNLNGVCQEYYASGVLERESTIINGLEEGLSKNYYQDGAIKGESNFQNGEKNGLTRLYYSTGSPRSEMNFTNGRPEGTQRLYYESGALRAEVEFSAGVRNGTIKQFYENGALQMEGTFEDDKLEGEVVIYYESGRVKSTQSFRDGRIIQS